MGSDQSAIIYFYAIKAPLTSRETQHQHKPQQSRKNEQNVEWNLEAQKITRHQQPREIISRANTRDRHTQKRDPVGRSGGSEG